MTDNTNQDKVEECNCSKKEMDGEEPAEQPCEAGYHKNDEGQCVPDEEPSEAPASEKKESIPDWARKLQTQYSDIQGTLEKLTKLEVSAGIRPVPKPISTVSNTSETFSWRDTVKKMNKWFESDRSTICSVSIPVEALRSTHIRKTRVGETYRSEYERDLKVKEALGYTGTQAGQDMDTDVALEPGGFSFVPVTQFAKYKEIAQGNDRARFFKHDLPAPITQTPGTTATVGTMDIESIEVTPSTITGVHLEIDTDDIENNPYDTVGVVVNASAARFDDFIGTDMLDTVSAEGTLTPLAWLKGSDGSVITTSDTASVVFDSTAIAAGKRYLLNQGLLKGGKKPVCVLHPQQYEDLLIDTGITNFTQFARPEITASGDLAELYGVRIVQSNAVQINSAQTNTAQNALMFVPGHSYGVASARNVTIKLQDKPEDNQVWATTSWRIKSGVIDANSIVRISSTQ